MDPDSCSMTPPLSPLLSGRDHEEQLNILEAIHMMETNQLPGLDGAELFFCSGKCGPSVCTTNRNSMLRSGIIQSLTEMFDVKRDAADNPTVELYGYTFCSAMALQEQAEQLFGLTRQKANYLFLMTRTTMRENNDVSKDCVGTRQQIREFFQYLKKFVNINTTAANEQDASLMVTLVDHLHSLLLSVGQMSDLPLEVVAASPASNGNESSNPLHHVFHLHLEMRWAIIELLHIISTKFQDLSPTRKVCVDKDGGDDYDRDVFYQATSMLLWDVVILAMKQHNKLSMAEYTRHPPWPCKCVQELLVMVIHLLQHRQKKMAKQSFWGMLFPIIQAVVADSTSGESSDQVAMEIDSDVSILPPEFSICDRVGFCWYLMLHISPLFNFDHLGYLLDEKNSQQSNYFILQTLLKRSITLPESHLRCHLHCLVVISAAWEPNPDIPVLLWDHFYKRLNDQFRTSNMSLEGLQCMSKTAQGILDQTNLTKAIDGETSFQIFLRLIAMHLASSQDQGGRSWRQVKGRFYSKFHSRRMQELTETGLNNFTLLFLTLAQVTNLQDVGEKLCDLYGLLGVGSLEGGRRTLVWRGLFALMLLYQKRGLDISFFAEKLVPTFNTLCSQLNEPGKDSLQHTDLWRLLGLYIENTQDIIDNSIALNLSEYKLLGTGFAELLNVASEYEIRTTLGFVQAVLTKHRLVYKRITSLSGENAVERRQHRELSDRLWQCFYKFVKQHSTTLTPPPQLADVAAGFCLLALEMPPSASCGVKEDFGPCFSHFAWGENVNPLLSCRFLCHMLPNITVMKRLHVTHRDAESYLIRAWLRCQFYIMPSTSDHLQELTRLIQKLSTVVELLSHVKQETIDETDSIFVHFLISLSIKFGTVEDFRGRMEFRDKACGYLTGIMSNINGSLRNCGSSGLNKHVYILAGQLVKHCAQIIYIKSKADCLLPQIVDRLALPRTLVHNKPLSPHVLGALRDALPLFIQGLSKLDYKRDPYIQRKIKDINIHYLNKFPLQSSADSAMVSAVHPLVRSLESSFTHDVPEDARLFRRYILDMMCIEHLTLRGSSTSSTASMVWNLVLDVFNKTQNTTEIARDASLLLAPALQHFLVVDNLAARSSTSAVLQHLLEACNKHIEAGEMAKLRSVITTFLGNNLPLYQGRAMKALEPISILFPPLLKAVIPDMTTAVKTTEKKRGVGIDKNLSHLKLSLAHAIHNFKVAYCALLTTLGDVGQQEKSRVLKDALSSAS